MYKMFMTRYEPHDVIFCVRGEKFPAHRDVLASASPYFQKMFFTNFKEKRTLEINIKMLSPQTFSNILKFIYTKECDLTSDIVDLLMASEYMGLPKLMVYVSLYLDYNLNVENCLEILRYCLCRGFENLSLKVTNFIINNRLLIQCFDASKDWNFEILQMLFSAAHLRYLHRAKLLKYLKYWLTVDPVNRCELMIDVIDTVQADGKIKNSIFEFTEELRNIIDSGQIKHSIPTKPNLDFFIVGGHAAKSPFSEHFITHNEHLTVQGNSINFKRYSIPTMRTKRLHFASASDKNGIYLIGGQGTDGLPLASVEYYDFDDDKWYLSDSLNEGVMFCAATSWDSLIYVSGGINAAGVVSSTASIHLQKHNLWKPITEMTVRRKGHQMCSVFGFIYSLGGHDGAQTLSSVEVYCPFDDVWRQLLPMKYPRQRFGAAVVDEFIFVFGGLGETEACVRIVEKYDTLHNTWELVSDEHPYYDSGVAVWEKDIYVCGGYNGVNTLNGIICLDSSSLVSKVVSQLKVSRRGPAAFILPDNKYYDQWQDFPN